MGEFFRGWRRKVGCVTLMMALVLVVGRMRSLLWEDEIPLPSIYIIPPMMIIAPTMHWIISSDNMLQYWKLPPDYYTSLRPVEPRMFFCIPYGSIAVPLTLLSAYLILWKPRKGGTYQSVSSPCEQPNPKKSIEFDIFCGLTELSPTQPQKVNDEGRMERN